MWGRPLMGTLASTSLRTRGLPRPQIIAVTRNSPVTRRRVLPERQAELVWLLELLAGNAVSIALGVSAIIYACAAGYLRIICDRAVAVIVICCLLFKLFWGHLHGNGCAEIAVGLVVIAAGKGRQKIGRGCRSTAGSIGCIKEVHSSIADSACQEPTNDEDGAKPEEAPPPVFRSRSLVLWSCYTPCGRRLIHSDQARRPLRDGAMLSPTIDGGRFRADKPFPRFFTWALSSLHALSSCW